MPLAKTARLAPPAPAPVSSQASTITFHYVDASTGEPITFNGNWASLPDLHGKGDVSSYTLTNTSSDPTMTIPGKTQYATTIPGYQYIGDANLDIPNQFAAGNLDVTLNYLSLAAVNVATLTLLILRPFYGTIRSPQPTSPRVIHIKRTITKFPLMAIILRRLLVPLLVHLVKPTT